MSAQSYPAKSPYCEHILDPANAHDGRVTCECGRSSDVAWVTELGWLQARAAWVADRVSSGEAWFDSRTGKPHEEVADVPPVNAGQRILYLLGGLSFITAVAVFVAVAWQDIGALGQVGVLWFLAAVAAALAVRTRIALPGLANTLAVISSGIVFVSLITGTQFGLLPDWWMSESSFYPAACVGFVGMASVLAGSHWRISGWLLIGAPAMPAAAIILFQVNLRYYIGDRYDNGLAFIATSAAIVAIGVRIRMILNLDSERFANIASVYVFGQLLLALVSLGQLAAFGIGGESSIFNALSVVVVGAMWVTVANNWRRSETDNPLTGLMALAAPLLAPALFGYSVVVAVAPSGFDVPTREAWLFYVVTSLVSAALILAPVIRPAMPKPLHRVIFIAMLTLLVGSYLRSGTFIDISGESSQAPSIFFATVLTIAFALRWRHGRHLGFFIAATVSGVNAISSLINWLQVPNAELELSTVPVAVWLFLCLAALRRTLTSTLNSAVWLGIPLGALMIPSAAASVAEIEFNAGTSYDWARMWVMLAASVGLTLIGATQRIAGLLWPAVVAYLLCTVPQLFVDLGLGIPRWVFFALLGSLLIATATRFERLQKMKQEAGSWDAVFR